MKFQEWRLLFGISKPLFRFEKGMLKNHEKSRTYIPPERGFSTIQIIDKNWTNWGIETIWTKHRRADPQATEWLRYSPTIRWGVREAVGRDTTHQIKQPRPKRSPPHTRNIDSLSTLGRSQHIQWGGADRKHFLSAPTTEQNRSCQDLFFNFGVCVWCIVSSTSSASGWLSSGGIRISR